MNVVDSHPACDTDVVAHPKAWFVTENSVLRNDFGTQCISICLSVCPCPKDFIIRSVITARRSSQHPTRVLDAGVKI
jgi:hypothetical protein